MGDIRVVKPGRVPFDLSGTCSRCGCEVEAMRSDDGVEHYVQDATISAFSCTDRYTCRCPTEGCGETIYLLERSRY